MNAQSQRQVVSQLQSSQNYVWNKADVLGHGATCEVYKAYHRKTGEPAAVKVFNKSGISRDMYQQQRELQLVRKLEHQNLVKVLAIEEEVHPSVTKNIVVMELCAGKSLFCFLSLPENRNGLEDDEFLCVLNDVTEGVIYLRENNVVHRDIKPGNIMRCIKEDGSSVYKLTDFGGARELEDDAVFMSLHGTEEYLHPDIYEKALVDKRAPGNFKAEVDLWSLGATFYHCAAGQTPFRPYQGRNDKATMFEMLKNKETGVISGQQKMKDGPIVYSKELPSKSPLSQSLKTLMEPILGSLLERDTEKAVTFEQYFEEIKTIKDMVCLRLLIMSECSYQKVYVKPNTTMTQFKTIIEDISNISPLNQFLLTERYIDIEHLEKDFLKYEELYVLPKNEVPQNMIFTASLLNNRFSSKTNTDMLSHDYSLAYARCIEAFHNSRELKNCLTHASLVSHAVQSLVDYCEDNPNRLEMNMSDLTARSSNLEDRRKDILSTNEAFIQIISLLIDIFHRIEPNVSNNICKLSPRTKQHLKSVLTDQLIVTICNKLQLPCNSDFDKFMNSIEVVDLNQIIQVLLEIPDQGINEFLTTCIATEIPITYILSMLEMNKSCLASWAMHKISSGTNIDEQLHALHAKIKEIQANSTGVDSSISEVMGRFKELENIMRNTLQNMMKIHDQFEADKKRKDALRVTTTVDLMHQLNRSYLETLKKRAYDVASEAVELCNKVNGCLKPRIQEFLTLQEALRKYRDEYKHDFDMLSEYENNLELWKSHMYENLLDLASKINTVALPVVESNDVKRQLMERISEFEKTNERNRLLCLENTEILRQLLKIHNVSA